MKKYFVTATLLFCFKLCSAQFTYLEFDLGYHYITYKKASDILYESEDAIRNNSMQGRLVGLYRANRFFGGGLAINLPMVQSTKHPLTSDDIYYSASEYEPNSVLYDLEEKVGVTIIGRFFFKPDAAINVDIRYTFVNVEETFNFARSGSKPANFYFSEDRKGKGPGLSVIYNIPIGESAYLKYQYSVDFLTFKRLPTFSKDIDFGDYSEIPRIESAIESKHNAHFFNIGFGYFF